MNGWSLIRCGDRAGFPKLSARFPKLRKIAEQYHALRWGIVQRQNIGL
jgi:hypothetical protein